MPEKKAVTTPLFFTVTVLEELTFHATFKNVRGVGVALITVTAAVPVPTSVATCGLVGSESLIVRVALKIPMFVGAKVTVTVQEPFAGTAPLHVLVCV